MPGKKNDSEKSSKLSSTSHPSAGSEAGSGLDSGSRDTRLEDSSLNYDIAADNPTRKQIALNTLARYSGSPIEAFQPYILLTNFPHYVDEFAKKMQVEATYGALLKVAHCPQSQISMIDYRVGAPMAALIIDVISYLKPEAAVMLGLCGGLHVEQQIGDLILPIAAIRDEGVSHHYMPERVPSLPAFMVQQLISEELLARSMPFRTGVLHTTDYRMWEFDEAFKINLKAEKATAIDMECSALFTAGFARKVPVGALMLISDLPMQPSGIKTEKSAKAMFAEFTRPHLEIAIDAVLRMQRVRIEQKINLRRFHFYSPRI